MVQRFLANPVPGSEYSQYEFFRTHYFLFLGLTIAVEALWCRIVLPLRFRQALLLSFTANLASYLGGVILFGF